MTPERWQRVKDVLHLALSRTPGERARAVSEACGDDPSLRREVAELLECDGVLGTFLDVPLLDTGLEPREEDAIPEELRSWERFRIGERLGSGGMAVVYKAWDPRLQRHIAVKFMAGGDELTVRRFLREAEAQARVEHENVLEVYETGVAGRYHYIAMQYVDGPSLTGVREETTLEEKLELLIRIAMGLHEAHRTGLVHRDIKPGNILVERTADALRPFLLDFGLAVELGAPSLTRTGVVIGTPRYMAPERIAGGAIVDRRSDVYSLGATFYELLSGVAPFSSGSTLQTLVDVMESEIPPLRGVAPSIPAEVEAVIMKCLERDPARRYPTARALAEDVRRYLDGEPVTARATGPVARMARRARRHPRLTAAFVLLVSLAIGVGTWAAFTSWRAGRQTDLARRLEQEVRDAEWLFRAAQMSPLHPIAPQKREVRRRMEHVAAIMRELGPLAEGPGHYALGRGHLTLRDNARALDALRRAWDAGHRTPDAAVALGLTHGEIYRHELTRAGRIADERARQRRIVELQRTHGASARSFLELGRRSSIMPPAYVDAVIHSVNDDATAAMASAERAMSVSPWLHEARLLQGALQFQQAYALYMKHDPAALQKARQAGRSYELAAEVAPSSADAHMGRCAVAGLLLHMRLHGAAVEVSDTPAGAAEGCARAVTVEPERAEAWRLYAEAVSFWANVQVGARKDPGDAYERAAALAHRAMTMSGHDLQSILTTAQVQLDRAWWQSRNGADPRPAVDEIVHAYERALRLDPRDHAAVNNIGLGLVLRARYEIAHALDAERSLDGAIAAFQRALRMSPDQAFAFSNLAKAAVERANQQQRRGADPRAGLEDVARFAEQLPGDPSFGPRVQCIEKVRARLRAG